MHVMGSLTLQAFFLFFNSKVNGYSIIFRVLHPRKPPQLVSHFLGIHASEEKHHTPTLLSHVL